MTGVSLGPEVVQRLIAQRPPMLWLDRITGIGLAPAALRGCRHLSANEAVFGGHFPRLGLMPGVLAMEGLAQAAEALATLLALRAGYDRDEDLLADLANLERGARLGPGYDAARAQALTARLAAGERVPSVAGSARVKFVRPIFPGSRLDYAVALTRRVDHTAHFTLDATVEGEPVVRGTFTTARLEGRPWLG